MFDRANVVSHAHSSANNPDGPKGASTSNTNTIESVSQSPKHKKKDELVMERCMSEMRDTSKNLIDSLKASDEIKMNLLMSISQTMQKLVEKL